MSYPMLAGRRLLVVEDEMLIAEELAERLNDAGAEIIGPIGWIDEAMAVAEQSGRIDAAILDVNLRGETVFPLADAMVARGVPLLFVTGYDMASLPPRFAGMPCSGKPAPVSAVADLLRSVECRAPLPASTGAGQGRQGVYSGGRY